MFLQNVFPLGPMNWIALLMPKKTTGHKYDIQRTEPHNFRGINQREVPPPLPFPPPPPVFPSHCLIDGVYMLSRRTQIASTRSQSSSAPNNGLCLGGLLHYYVNFACDVLACHHTV